MMRTGWDNLSNLLGVLELRMKRKHIHVLKIVALFVFDKRKFLILRPELLIKLVVFSEELVVRTIGSYSVK